MWGEEAPKWRRTDSEIIFDNISSKTAQLNITEDARTDSIQDEIMNELTSHEQINNK